MELPSYLKSIDQALAPSVPVTPVLPTAPSATVTTQPTLPQQAQTPSATPTFSFDTAPLTNFNATTSSRQTPSSEKNKLRFMLVSTHAQQFTGYSKVSYGILEQLAKQPWLDLTHFGFQRHPQTPPNFRPYPSNVSVVDAAALESPPQQGFGYQALVDTIRKKQPQVVMIYNDMAVVTRFLEEIRKSGIQRNFKLWIYCDQVYDCQLQGMIDILNRDADRVFAFTAYWKKQLKDQGVTRPLSVLGHGFDPRVFYTLPRELARKSLKLPDDAFVIMSLNRNQPRKRHDIMIMAFVELVVKYPNRPILLLCICDKGEKGGWWLFEIFVRELKKRGVPIEQFGNRLMISSQDMVFKDEDINVLYNVADVGISTAEGEGWGLCTFEQMGVGIPQVVPDIGGYKEFCREDNSALVKPKYSYYLPSVYSPVGGEAHVCDPHDVCLAMEEYLNDSSKKARHGAKAKETVLGYTWEKATSELLKCLETERNDV
jgi:glycosyltransferase involved in cell wall biosynthesis